MIVLWLGARYIPASCCTGCRSGILRHGGGELAGRVDGVRPRQPGDHDQHQDRGQAVADPLRLAVVGKLRQVLQQAAVVAHVQLVEVRQARPVSGRVSNAAVSALIPPGASSLTQYAFGCPWRT